jgi:hypothetical protein
MCPDVPRPEQRSHLNRQQRSRNRDEESSQREVHTGLRTRAVNARPARQPVLRVRSVWVGLTEEEYGEVGEAAAQAGMAKGAYAAQATLAARGVMNPADVPFRQALTELIRAAGQVRRIGVNLN